MLWFVFALVIGAGVVGLITWSRNRSIEITWYQWLMGAISILLLVGGIQHYTGSLAEGFPAAGMLGLLVFGVPGLLLLVATWMIIGRKQRAS